MSRTPDEGGFDEFAVHGRFPVGADVDPLSEGFMFEISNNAADKLLVDDHNSIWV